jgi:hypothetical protein
MWAEVNGDFVRRVFPGLPGFFRFTVPVARLGCGEAHRQEQGVAPDRGVSVAAVVYLERQEGRPVVDQEIAMTETEIIREKS